MKAVVSRLLLRAGLNYQFRHRWQAFLALSGIVMGVAIVLAVDLANAAARASFELSTQQIRGATTHRIIGNNGEVPQSLYTQLFTTPGHPPIAPVINAKLQLEGFDREVRLIGLDLFAEQGFRQDLPDTLQQGSVLSDWLTDPEAVAISQAAAGYFQLKLHDRLTVRYQGQSYDLKVLIINPSSSVISRDLLLVDIATAQAITGMNESLSYIDLILADGDQKWIKDRLPDSVKLVDAEQQSQNMVGLSAAFELNLTAMSLLALLVGLFLIFNAMSFSIVQRRSLLGRLRALGVTRGEIYRVIMAEAFVLGVIGTLIGWVVGIWLGQGLTKIVAATINDLYYHVSVDSMQLSYLSFIKASGLGLAGTLVATWFPARQAANTTPVTTLSRAELETFIHHKIPLMALIGVVLTGIGLLVSFQLPGGVISAFGGLFMVILGFALITPAALPLTQSLLSSLALGGIWRMALRDIKRHLSRLATATAALMVALAATVGVAVMVDSMRGSVSGWLEDLLSADLYIASADFQQDASLPLQVVQQVDSLDTVSAVSLYRDRQLLVQQHPVRLVAAQLAKDSRKGFDFTQQADQDPWVKFEQGDLLISEPLAHRLKLQAGQQLILPTLSGDIKFRITAVFRDYASEHGRIFMPLRFYQQYWSDSLIDTMALFSAEADSDAIQQQARARFANRYNLVYTQAKDIYRESMIVFDRTFRITEVLRYLSILVAFIGILSALMAVQLERRKEFAILRALGFTRFQVSQLIITESMIIGFLAALIAIPCGLTLAWVLTDAVQLRAFGWTMPFLWSANPLYWTLFQGMAAALLASLYPAWKASRGDPAPQMRED